MEANAFGRIDPELILRHLQKPVGKIDVVLDTDTYNEIDDQYAIAYLLRSDKKLSLKAIYAAPFLNKKVANPKEGMERSYEEILKVLGYMDKSELGAIVFKGSERFHPDETKAVDSPAARDLASRAMKYTPEKPLYVIAIGAITNVTSALLLNPGIRDRMVVIWLGGCAYHWPHNREFNLRQDVAGGRILFGCGAAVVQVPAHGVVSSFRTGEPELEHWLRGKNRICEYLLENTLREARETNAGPAWTRAIWDVVPVAWLLEEDFVQDYLVHSPIPEYDHHYSFSAARHFIRYVYHVNRDRVFLDLFTKLAKTDETIK